MLAILIVGFPLRLWKAVVVEDSLLYLDVSRMPLREALASIRTVGYPLFLRLVASISPEYAIVPLVHLAILCAVVFLLDGGLRRFGPRPGSPLPQARDSCTPRHSCTP